jgi:cystathionine beta-lyase
MDDELESVLAIARRHDLVVLSDEIHCDLVFPDKPRHRVLATLAKPEDQLITAVAPSKSFNMPGLGLSALVSSNRKVLGAMRAEFERWHMPQCNPFSIAGFEAGYREGGSWLDELMTYLQGSRDEVIETIRSRLPGIRVQEPEGSYLLWLDCRELGLTNAQLKRFFVQEAGVGLNPGYTFGSQGSGFMRLNLGSPRPVLREALARIEKALGKL